MNQLKFMRVLFPVMLFAAALMTACSDDDTASTVTIRYAEIGDIGPSMNYTSEQPSSYGAAPSEFAIEGITLEGEAFNDQNGSFTINAATGAVTISNTNDLVPGLYALSIACKAGGQINRFADVFKVHMLAATPHAVTVTPSILEIKYADVKTSTASAQITPADESVSLNAYQLVQEEGKEYFTVTKEGKIKINPAFTGDILPGVYTPQLKLGSMAGTAFYENTVTIRITSAPLAVSYDPAEGTAEVNRAFSSATPVLKGSTEGGVTWKIKSVTPSTDKFSIDASTGVVSLAADNGLPIGNHYALTLTVTNSYGSADFAAGYAVNIVAYITPIDAAKFSYAASEQIQGTAFTIEKADGFAGDNVTFSLAEVPAAIDGQIAIDPSTGALSARKGNSMPLGSYTVKVKAENSKGSATVDAKLSIIENPYYFTSISYGNNLSLTPAADYASQFRFATADAMVAASGMLPTTDAKTGTSLTWSVVSRWKMVDVTIDASTGALTFATTSFDSGAVTGLLFVTATAGKGKVGETTVTMPVFFICQADATVSVSSTPFVVKINPKTGGAATTALKVTGVSDMTKFAIDFRRTFQYFNLNGPDSHVSGDPKTAGSLLNTLYTQYFKVDMGASSVNTGAKDPFSYYVNQSKGKLSAALAYVDATTLKLTVNPAKWRDDNGYANGCFFGEMTYITNASGTIATDNTSLSGSSLKSRPIWIWFDEKF